MLDPNVHCERRPVEAFNLRRMRNIVRDGRFHTYLRQPGGDSFAGYTQSFRRYVHWLGSSRNCSLKSSERRSNHCAD
jgi:hypothetical protein